MRRPQMKVRTVSGRALVVILRAIAARETTPPPPQPAPTPKKRGAQ